jgi:GTP-binding protein Era
MTASEQEKEAFRCGSIALIGRPNVGKSTLLNSLLGKKLSITSNKPQTTRHQIRGILTNDDAQYIFVDTPGFQTQHRTGLNRFMNRGVRNALDDVDVVALVIEAGRFGADDRALLQLVPPGLPLFLVPNKTDKSPPESLLPHLATASREAQFAEIVPVSAQRHKGLSDLLRTFRRYLPEQPAIYPADEMTDRDERFLAAELVREKMFRLMGDELPYGASVMIEKFEDTGRLRRIFASIIVDKDNHKAIVIGAGGEKLKAIASGARVDMEKLFGAKVYLEVWVKVRNGWIDDPRALRHMGYE